MTNLRSSLLAAALLGVLAGCGGGDGGGSAPPPPPPPSAGPSPTCTGAEAFSAVSDATVAVGKVAGAVIAGCTGQLTEVRWTQTGGPSVALLSANSQAISFEPPSAATYTFRVDFRDASGVPRTASVSTVATGTTATGTFVARIDHAVRKGGSASVRAWPAAESGDTITWTQTAGPLVTLDATNTDQNLILFTAPQVTRDTTLVFRATRRTSAGVTDTDDVMVLVENYAQAPADPANTGPYVFGDIHVSRVHPYKPAGPYAPVLVRCAFDANLQYFGAGTNTCSMATLPFLHTTTAGGVPTVAQIMDRVLVSHDWMGQVFEQFLATQAGDDLKRLFNGVTAIVIGAHIRPSFYYAATGAIYLDADNFWLTAEQRDTINETPDFRLEFDRDLQYSGAWRYTSTTNGVTQSIFVNFPPTSRIARDLGYLLAESGWLLYHELGHASDFLPPAERPRLNSSLSQTVWEFIWPMYSARALPSDRLTSAFPLISSEMSGLAQVKFFGVAANELQKSYTPDQVGAFFAVDRSTDEYSYSTSREDATMLFEEVMMYRNHGWRRDAAFTDKRLPDSTGSTLIVRWGQRGRIGAALIKPRAELIVGALAPWVLAADPGLVQNLPAPIQMRPGESWTANLALPAPPQGLASVQALRTPLDFASARAALMRDVGRHHGGSANDRLLKRGGR